MNKKKVPVRQHTRIVRVRRLPDSERRKMISVRVLPKTQRSLKRLFKPYGGLGRYLDAVVDQGRVPHVKQKRK